MKNLIPVTMLLAFGIALPIDASALPTKHAMEKQRAANKAQAEKVMRLRSGKRQLKRHFDRSEAEAAHDRSLKLDAIAPSPRHAAKSTSRKSEQTRPANPRRTTSTDKSEHGTEAARTPKE